MSPYTNRADGGRFLYYLIGTSAFWRYDTVADSYTQLASPPIAPATWSTLRYLENYGYESQVISAGSSNIVSAAYYGNAFKGLEITIIEGTGIGQQRKITDVADVVESDSGVVTSVSTASIGDSTKNWAINQWVGYQLRIKFGSGISQVRKILYNDATTITFQDANRASVDYNAIVASPSPAFSSTAGAQSIYSIESSVITVNDNWVTTPDATSKFRITSGSVVMISSAAATPFYTIQSYDCISDTWHIKIAGGTMVPSAGTDGSFDSTVATGSLWDNGTATGGSTTTLVDSTKSWKVNSFVDRYLNITSGTGKSQLLKITANTATSLTFATATAPDATSVYKIEGFDGGTASGGSTSTLVDSSKSWATDRWKNFMVKIIAGTGIGQTLNILSNSATTLTTYSRWAIAPDNTSKYIIQGDRDNLYIQLGGFSTLMLNSIQANMPTYGRIYDYGLVRIGSAQYGNAPPVPITSISGAGTTKTVTTAIPHNFKSGITVSHLGDTGASAVTNNISAVITVTSTTSYTFTAPSSTAAVTYTGLSVTVIKDVSKSWVVNEHANRIVYFTTTAPSNTTGAATVVSMEILSNTADTLTLKASQTISLNGLSKYIISDRPALGSLDSGIATGTQSVTTLQDTSKTWVVNQWAGRRLKMLSGTGQGIEITITSNTSNTLTFATTTAPLAGATSYSILTGYPKGTGIDLMWTPRVSDITSQGKMLMCPRGGGVTGFDRFDITTDQWYTFSFSPQPETLTTGSMYAYDGGNRIYFTKEATQRCFYLDLDTERIYGAGTTPYIAGTAILGNRFEIITTADGLNYLWYNRHANLDCFRQLIFY
jgi:hypothetical protein